MTNHVAADVKPVVVKTEAPATTTANITLSDVCMFIKKNYGVCYFVIFGVYCDGFVASYGTLINVSCVGGGISNLYPPGSFSGLW